MEIVKGNQEKEAETSFNFNLFDATKYIKGLKDYLYNPRRNGYIKTNKDRFENKPDPLNLIEIADIEQEIKTWEEYIRIIKITQDNVKTDIHSKVAN